MKLSYSTIVAMNLAKSHLEPGDSLILTLRNEDNDEGMFAQAKRLNSIFLQTFAFWPSEIAVHPDHLPLLKSMNKTLDITISEAAALIIGKHVNLLDLPHRVPIVGDASMDVFTCVARFHFHKKLQQEYQEHIIQYVLDSYKED